MHVIKKKESNAREQADEEERQRQLERLKRETMRSKMIKRRSSNREAYKAAKKLSMTDSKAKILSTDNNDLEDPLQEMLEGYQEMVDQGIIDKSELE